MKRKKAEDFVGWVSLDGKLKVTGIIEKAKHTKFRVECSECAKDPELFPAGYFVSYRKSLEAGHKPCGCSNNYKCDINQYEVKIKRVLEHKSILFCGFIGKFKGKDTRLKLKCDIDGHEWDASIGNILQGTGCKKCHFVKLKNLKRKSETDIREELESKCKQYDYKFIDFIGEYENSHSYFKYTCREHGEQTVSISNFLYGDTKCPDCNSTGYNKDKPGHLYVVLWYNKNCGFVKFGITNNSVYDRIGIQQRGTIFSPKVLFIKQWEDGSIPFNIEYSIKNKSKIKRNVVSKDIFSDGFTETIRYTDIDKLMTYISEEENKYT